MKLVYGGRLLKIRLSQSKALSIWAFFKIANNCYVFLMALVHVLIKANTLELSWLGFTSLNDRSLNKKFIDITALNITICYVQRVC
jgi:hypothetical protein